MPRLIIHAGPPKSGTTSIQRGLVKKVDVFRKAGIHYYYRPGPWQWALILPYRRKDNSAFLPLALRKHFTTIEQALEWCETEWTRFENWVKAESPDIVLVSSEYFAFSGDLPAVVQRLSQSFDRIDVIGYARHPVDAAVSGFEELIRTGWDLYGLPDLSAEPANSARNLRPYESLLGHGNLHIGRFSRSALLNGDVVADFFNRLQILTGESIPPPESPSDDNPGVCGAAVAWFLMVNQEQKIRNRPSNEFAPFFKKRKALVDQFRASATMSCLPRLKMTDPVLQGLILHRSKGTLQWLNDNYLMDDDSFEIGEPIAVIPGRAEVRSRISTWLQSYLTPDAVEILFREIVH